MPRTRTNFVELFNLAAANGLQHAAKALAPGGAMFLSLHNARQFLVVLSEPHYGVPGLVLLPPAEAGACWLHVREGLGSAVDYEVTTWPLYPDLAKVCRSIGFSVRPWIDCSSAYDPAFWQAPPVAITEVSARAAVELERLQIPQPYASRLTAAVAAYQGEAVAAFARAATETERVEYFITYHAQPLNLLLSI